MKPFIVVLLFGLSISLRAQAPQSSGNTDLQMMVDEDQRIRTGGPLTAAERVRIVRTDADRRAVVKQMIAADKLQTAIDYRNAALILQHGSIAEDYLLAHTLAIIAVSMGDKVALWLSSATLDRYLLSIKEPQIYGTQYNHFDLTKPWTQEPYAPSLVPDVLRKELGVPSSAEQKKELENLNQPSLVK